MHFNENANVFYSSLCPRCTVHIANALELWKERGREGGREEKVAGHPGKQWLCEKPTKINK